MDARDLLLEEHSAMHSPVVGGNKASMAERTFAGLTDEQMRVRPREDLNSLAWIMWHIARAEDIMANVIVNGRNQVLDDGWAPRLKIARPDFGIGMSKAEPLHRFTRRIPSGKFEPASGPATLCAIAVETDDATGLATRIAPVRLGGRLTEARPDFWD